MCIFEIFQNSHASHIDIHQGIEMASSKLIEMFSISFIPYWEMHSKVLCNRSQVSFSDISVIVTAAVQVVEQATQAGFLIITQSHTD